MVDSTCERGNGLVASTTYTYYPDGPAKDQKWTESNPVSGTITFTYDDNNNVDTETRQRTVNDVTIEEVTSDYSFTPIRSELA